jgi:hypothetical protein
MNTRPIPPGTAPCFACGYPVARRDNTGNISISITVNPGVNIMLRGPICLGCTRKAKESPEAALAVLRTAAPRMLAPGEAE